MGDPLSDCSPLISAAASGKLRLVRLLIEGGAQVNGRNPRGETALLATCKALRGEPEGPDTVKLLAYLLQNKADPNAQDRTGRTALMYACMEQAGAHVVSTLLSAGADPSMEDYSGASALVYAINAQHQPTLELLMDACRARGHDIIIIATETGVNGSPVTRRYLNVPPSPDTSPVSCMSPSDIVLKTGSPNSPEGENIFNFRGTSKRGSSSSSRYPSNEQSPLGQCSTPRPPRPPRQRLFSGPCLAIHNLACLNRAYEEGLRERGQQEEINTEDLGMESGGRVNDHREYEESHFHLSKMEEMRDIYNRCYKGFLPRVSQSLLSLTDMCSSQAISSRFMFNRCVTPEVSTSDTTAQNYLHNDLSIDKLPACPPPHSQLRRNTLPSVMVVPPLLHLPPLVNQSDSHLQVPTQVSPSKSRSMVFLPHPPYSSPPHSSSSRASSLRPALLPPLPLASSVASLVAPPATCCSERNRRSLCHHSVQLKQIRGGRQEKTNNVDSED